MAAEERLDLPRLDAHPAPANAVLLPADDDQITSSVVTGQVSGAEPAVGSPRFAGSGVVAKISRGATRATSPDLTGLSGRDVASRVVHQANLRVPARPAHRVPADLRWVRRRRHRPPSEVDRKSTRLNSSHSQISYAVFC